MLPDKVRKAVLSENMLPDPGGPRLVLCALSGGADSVALTEALLALSGPLSLSVAAAHYNHGLRGAESDRDEAFVRAYCARRGVPLRCGRGDVAAQAAREKRGVEETARSARYAFLTCAARKLGAAAVATAHSADDNLETVLLNLTRGAGLSGLCGIPPVRDEGGVRIIRPLLFSTRAEIEEYLAALGETYITDSSNLTDDYARNRLRHRVLPVLRALNPSAAQGVLGTCRLLREDARELDTRARAAADKAVRRGEALCYPVRTLLALPPALSGRVARLLIARAHALFFPDAGRPGAARPDGGLAAVRAVLDTASNPSPSAMADLPGGLRVRREYGTLRFEPALPDPLLVPRPLSLPGRTEFPEAGLVLEAHFTEKSSGNSDCFHKLSVDSLKIHGILSVRVRKPGDRTVLPGRAGSHSLKKLLIDAGIPRRLRGLVPVIYDGDGIVAVPGFGVDARCVPADGDLCIEIAVSRPDGLPVHDFFLGLPDRAEEIAEKQREKTGNGD